MRLPTCVMVLVLLNCSAVAQSTLAPRDLDAMFLRLETDWAVALQQHDMKALESTLANEFTYSNPVLLSSADKALSRRDWLAGSKDVVLESFTIEHLVAKREGDLVTVFAIVDQKAELPKGVDHSGRYWLVDTWVLRGGKWQAITRYGGGLCGRKPPAGAAPVSPQSAPK